MTVLCLTMCSEIETKLKVDSHQPIEATLAKLGAEFIEVQLQHDDYLDDANNTLAREDKCLRLRSQESGNNRKTFLTYKGPKEQHQIKKRTEIEIQITGAQNTETLLTALGYKPMLTVEKKRKLWTFHQCDIALDELPLLGTYVEIEGPDAERIAEVQKAMHLDQLPHINQSYACLIQRQLNQKA